jgi:alkylresorcinol/alkylpyrone synthase
MPAPRLAELATAVPAHVLDQDAIRAAAAEHGIFGDALRVNSPMWRVFDNAGIATRRSCMPIEWHARGHGWRERSQVYLESALALLETARATAWRAPVAASRRSMRGDRRHHWHRDALARGASAQPAAVAQRHHPPADLRPAAPAAGLARAADPCADPRRRVLLLVVEFAPHLPAAGTAR